MEEIWKDIKNYEGLYQVSNLGQIRRIKFINNITEKDKITIISQGFQNSGYLKVCLYKNDKMKNKLVHRLVAETFIPNPNNLPFVNHKDGNKQNNKVDNLEWCTQSENMKHAYKNGLTKAYAKGKYGKDSLKAIKINMLDKNTGEIIKQFGSIIDGAKYIGQNKSCHIVSCCKGRLKTAYGYKWEYADKSSTKSIR